MVGWGVTPAQTGHVTAFHQIVCIPRTLFLVLVAFIISKQVRYGSETSGGGRWRWCILWSEMGVRVWSPSSTRRRDPTSDPPFPGITIVDDDDHFLRCHNYDVHHRDDSSTCTEIDR